MRKVILEIGKKMLEALGYIVLAAGGGKEAIETYRKEKDRIAIIILDIIMPDVGGGQTFEVLKSINPNAKVLLSSGYSLNGEATKILNRGGRGFLQKPFKLNDLSRKLREILAGDPSSQLNTGGQST